MLFEEILKRIVNQELVTCFKLDVPYPPYEDESRNWTSDHFSLSKAIAKGSRYLQNQLVYLIAKEVEKDYYSCIEKYHFLIFH